VLLLRAFLVEREHSGVVYGVSGRHIQAVQNFWEETNKSLDKIKRRLVVIWDLTNGNWWSGRWS